MNPRRRRKLRLWRVERKRAERALSIEACLYGYVHTRQEAPFTGTFAEWRKLDGFKRLGILYHDHLIKQMNRRCVWLDLLKPLPKPELAIALPRLPEPPDMLAALLSPRPR